MGRNNGDSGGVKSPAGVEFLSLISWSKEPIVGEAAGEGPAGESKYDARGGGVAPQ